MKGHLLALLALPALVAAAPAVEKPPNVIIFLADDLGYGNLACYGHPRIRTPNLDAFARQGVRLTQCYAASAVCSPSRSAILTGRTPHRNGVYTWIAEGSEVHLPASEITLAKWSSPRTTVRKETVQKAVHEAAPAGFVGGSGPCTRAEFACLGSSAGQGACRRV